MLKKLGIVKSKTKGYHVFMEHIAPDFMSNTMEPSEYVRYCWNNYENSGVERNNSLNGTIFELIIGILFPQKQCMARENDDTTDDENITENEDVVTDNSDRTTKNAAERADSAIDPDEDSLDEQIGLAMQNLPSSMGYSFLAKGNCDRLVFSLAFATYDNAKMEDCAYPIPVDLPDGYNLPPEVSYCLKYDASHNCLRLIYKITKKDINDLREIDSMPENERGWIINGLYRLFDQFHSGFVRQPHGMMDIFAEFAACKNSGVRADSAEAQALVANLQAHITANYYTCTDEIFAGLSKMYVADERFKKNIDKYGEGTAEFTANAIAVYTKKL